MKFHRFILVLLVAGVGCTSPSAGPGDDDDDASSAMSTPSTDARANNLSAFFAVPLPDGTTDAALREKVIELAGQAAPNSHIYIAMYKWSDKSVAQAFIDAYNRKVDVQIVLDGEKNELPATADAYADDDPDTEDPDLDAAITMLEGVLPPGSITLCMRDNGSCQGDHINHNKFYLFSELTDGSKNVVVQSSANLTNIHLHNNLVIDRNDPDLYAGYLSYFGDLVKHELDLNYYRSFDGNDTKSYFFPRAEGDTIVSVLDKVKCTSDSKIRVTMAFFTDGRIAIAKRLVQLQADGCDVRVLMRHAGPQDSADIISLFDHNQVQVGLYPAAHGSNIHSKYLLIDSKYGTPGDYSHRQLVFTGSHNYATDSLRNNDEALMRVDDPTIFAAFMDNWNTIRAQIPEHDIKQ